MVSDSGGERELATMHQPDAGSEDVLMDERMLATVSNAPNAAAMPQMYVSQCKKVYLGHRYISVTQKVRTTQEIKGQLLGLELVSANNSRKLRCSVAVFVCWALLVTIGLSFYIFRNALYKKVTKIDLGQLLGLELVSANNSRKLRCSVAVFVCWALLVTIGLSFYVFRYALYDSGAIIDLDIHESWYLRRGDWQALPAYSVDYLAIPLSYAIISHSVSGYCTKKVDCIVKILSVQKSHIDARFEDIGPNFLVTGNGLIVEGRGANVFGSVSKSWNRKSISIMFLGDYRTDKTNPEQFEHVDILLNQLVKQGVLTPDYKLYGQCQLNTLTVSPGPNIMKKLKHFEHWKPEKANMCLPG